MIGVVISLTVIEAMRLNVNIPEKPTLTRQEFADAVIHIAESLWLPQEVTKPLSDLDYGSFTLKLQAFMQAFRLARWDKS